MNTEALNEKQINWLKSKGFRIVADGSGPTGEIAARLYLVPAGCSADRDGWVIRDGKATGQVAQWITVARERGEWREGHTVSFRGLSYTRPDARDAIERALARVHGLTAPRQFGGWGWDLVVSP